MSAIYRATTIVFSAGYRSLAVDLRSIGHENIPSHGPAVLATNHISYLDFSFVCLAPPPPRREVRFMARKEFFDRPLAGFLLRRMGQIPVDVHGDPMAAAELAGKALARGDLVGIHPEGTISPSFVPRRAKTGALRMAEAAGAPVIPVAIWGSHRLLTKGRPLRPSRHVTVVVRFGEPLEATGRTAMARSAELTGRIRDLLAEVQAEYPQQPGPPPDDWWLPAHLGGSAPTLEEAEALLAEQEERRRAERRPG